MGRSEAGISLSTKRISFSTKTTLGFQPRVV